jgi:hypothetical protein
MCLKSIRDAKQLLAKLNDNDDKAPARSGRFDPGKSADELVVLPERHLFHDIQLMQDFCCSWIISSILDEEQAVVT